MTRVPTSRGSTDDLRRLDVLDSGGASALSKDGDFPLPFGISMEPMGVKMSWKAQEEMLKDELKKLYQHTLDFKLSLIIYNANIS